ncbi:MAG: hypothetical protein D6784_03915, partial [Chloroflexi bacterium]
MADLTKQRVNSRVVTWAVVVLLALLSLACAFGGSGDTGYRVQKILPTITPTAVALADFAVEEAASSTDTASPAQPETGDSPALAGQTARQAPRFVVVPQNPPPAPAAPSTAPGASPGYVPPAPSAGQTPAAAPQFNPTPTIPPTPRPVFTPVPTPTPLPTATPRPTPPLPPAVAGWSFVGVRAALEDTDAVVVGELYNHTGIPQTDIFVSGVFYNAQNQVIDGEIDVLSHVPVDVIPPGARVPFELQVESPEPIYRLDLYAMSEPAGNPPRQDFHFANVTEKVTASNLYCVEGNIINPAEPVEDYLLVMAVAYNREN